VKQPRLFHKTDIVIIVLFFVLYMIGYAWLIEPKKETTKKTEKNSVMQQPESRQTEKRQPKSLSADWPLDLGKYFYTIDIAPGYEMENEEYEVVGESGGNLIVRKHNDWPDISGHFEWYCNEKLTTTQQMFDYVAAHHKTIVRQMQEVKKRGLSNPIDEASYYQDHYDEYQDDPEDEISFPPEIFDANDD
jgi:hypothetical protein